MGTPGRKPPSAEKLALAARLLDEGWPFQEITRTHGISYYSLNKHFPGRQWTYKEAADHGVMMKKLKIRKRTDLPKGPEIRIVSH